MEQVRKPITLDTQLDPITGAWHETNTDSEPPFPLISEERLLFNFLSIKEEN